MSDISEVPAIDAAHVSERVRDWVDRVDGLYRQVEAWAAGAGQSTQRERAAVRMHEPMMQRMGVGPAALDALVVGGRIRLAPVALWVIAGNGRVDATGPKGEMTIVDLAEMLEPARWTSVDRMRGRQEPFDPRMLLELL